MSVDSGFQPGQELRTREGVFVVDKRLGAGAAGFTYKVVSESLKTPRVMKVMRGESVGDAKARRRFRDEALIMAKLGAHPNIVTVLHRGNLREGKRELPYYVTEWVHGASLIALKEACNREGRTVPILLAIKLVSDVLQGLAFIHQRGVVHCDIKPHNVLASVLNDGTLCGRIIDFDAALLLENPVQEQIHLSPLYAPPEQYAKTQLNPKTDVFAAAVMLFEMLTGHLPFPMPRYGDDPFAFASQRFAAPATLLSQFGDFPPELTHGMTSALSRNADERLDLKVFLRTLINVGNALRRAGATISLEGLLAPDSTPMQPIGRADLGATNPGSEPPPEPRVQRTEPLGRAGASPQQNAHEQEQEAPSLDSLLAGLDRSEEQLQQERLWVKQQERLRAERERVAQEALRREDHAEERQAETSFLNEGRQRWEHALASTPPPADTEGPMTPSWRPAPATVRAELEQSPRQPSVHDALTVRTLSAESPIVAGSREPPIVNRASPEVIAARLAPEANAPVRDRSPEVIAALPVMRDRSPETIMPWRPNVIAVNLSSAESASLRRGAGGSTLRSPESARTPGVPPRSAHATAPLGPPRIVAPQVAIVQPLRNATAPMVTLPRVNRPRPTPQRPRNGRRIALWTGVATVLGGLLVWLVILILRRYT